MNATNSSVPKIILITNSAWNVYNFRMQLIEYLNKVGCDVVVLAPQDKYSIFIQQCGYCKLIHLQQLDALGVNLFKDFRLLAELNTLLKQEKPDAILTFTIKPNLFGSIIARYWNIPIVPTVTGLGHSFLHKSWLNWVVRSLYRFSFQGLNKVVFHNQSDYELLKKLKILHPGQGVVVGGSGVDTDHFQASAPPQTKPFVFLFLGRILYDKGLAELVEAARRMRHDTPNVQFWVAGTQQPEHPATIPFDKFQLWVDEGIIQYFGQVEDVRPLIAKAHVVVLPSYREGMPRAILEAMAMARPVIATDVPGCRDAVVPGWNGWLTEPRNVEHLELCLRKALQQEHRVLKKMGKNGRERVIDFFDQRQVQAQYLSMLYALNYIHAEVQATPTAHTPVL